MNYQRIYNLLIERGKNRDLGDVYKERHHIIPRCIGGSDLDDNLVHLTPEEHFLAHQLLVKIFPGNAKLIFALSAMCMNADSKKMIRNNKMFGWIKRNISECRKGIPRSIETRQKLSAANKGKKLSDEAKLKISEKSKGRKLTTEHKANISSGQIGKVVSDDTKAKISKSLKGKNKGKTYEEIYGPDKASELKASRSKNMKGRPKSEEHKSKLSAANKGKIPTESTRTKISQANKGKSTSEETKQKIRNTKLANRLPKQAVKDIPALVGGRKVPIEYTQ